MRDYLEVEAYVAWQREVVAPYQVTFKMLLFTNIS